MVVIGLLLLVVGVVALIDIALSSTGTTAVQLFGWQLGTFKPGWVLLIGTAIGAVLMLGLVLVLSGQRRGRRRYRQRERALASKNAENRLLAAQLEEERERANQDQATVRTVPSTVPTGLVTTPEEPYPQVSHDDRDVGRTSETTPADSPER